MMPIGELMIEHRLIERVINQMRKELEIINSAHSVQLIKIHQIIDFINNYADKCHHGKEEDILFRELDGKELSAEHRKIINELIQDHIFGRDILGKLINAARDYEKGYPGAFEMIVDCLKKLTDFYPKHILKEDKSFFLPCMEYFTGFEKEEMLGKFNEFDKAMFHSMYKKIVEKIEELV